MSVRPSVVARSVGRVARLRVRLEERAGLGAERAIGGGLVGRAAAADMTGGTYSTGRRRHQRLDPVEDAVDAGAVEREAAVDHDVLAGDEPGEVRAEEHDDVGDVLGLADPADRACRRS